MDQSLELWQKGYNPEFTKCFNPYFSGSVTGTAAAVKFIFDGLVFQSLF